MSIQAAVTILDKPAALPYTTAEKMAAILKRDADQRAGQEARNDLIEHSLMAVPVGGHHKNGQPCIDWQVIFTYASGYTKLVRSIARSPSLVWETIGYPND